MVEQWTTRAPGRPGCVGGTELDPFRCRIYGVAPLQYIGGEPPVNPLTAERIELVSIDDGVIENEVHLRSPGDVALNPSGELYAISARSIVRVDLKDWRQRTFVEDAGEPCALTFDRHGNLYVFDASQRIIRVYNKPGRQIRTIATPGGLKLGPWDPTTFHPNVFSMDIDM